MNRLQQAEVNGARLVGEVTQARVTADSARRAAEEVVRLFDLEKPGWVTVGRITIDRETETEKFERTSETATDRIAAIISKRFAAAPADNDAEARRLLTECCYTIQQLAEQQAMPDNFYERALQAVGRFLGSDATTKGDR